jgi:hypothetical protein
MLAIFVKGSARRADKGIRWVRGKGVPDRVVDAAIDATLDALDQPRTRPEIAERVSRTLGVQMQAIQGGGWGSRRKVAAVPVGDLIFPVVDLRRMKLALLASFAAACAFVAVACIRSANRHYHLIHPELHLESSSAVLTV